MKAPTKAQLIEQARALNIELPEQPGKLTNAALAQLISDTGAVPGTSDTAPGAEASDSPADWHPDGPSEPDTNHRPV
jgi:hypothetical protein